MRYSEILAERANPQGDPVEAADRNMTVVVRAREVIRAFQAFLLKHDGTALKDMPGVVHLTDKKRGLGVYTWNVRKVCPDVPFQNLAIGVEYYFGKTMPNREACFTLSGDRQTGMVLMNMGASDPADEDQVKYLFNWEAVAHELIHYFDWRRFKRQEDWHKRNAAIANSKANRSNDPQSQRSREMADQGVYYNNEKEMNAYFQQGAYLIVDDMVKTLTQQRKYAEEDPDFDNDFYKWSTLVNFDRFRDRYLYSFDPRWRRALTPNNKKRFARRFYKLFLLAKTKWPNVPAIQRDMADD